jgi:hypothetical protein
MMAEAFLSLLDHVQPATRGWKARCPAHQPDKNPSLGIREGDRGLLVRCWTGCSLEDITRALGLRVVDIFYDRDMPDSPGRREAIQQRARARAAQQAAAQTKGRQSDALREAEHLVRAAQGLSVATWTDDELAIALDSVGRAWHLLGAKGLQHA